MGKRLQKAVSWDCAGGPSGLDACTELLKTAREKEEYFEELADKGVLNSRYSRKNKYQQWGSVSAACKSQETSEQNRH